MTKIDAQPEALRLAHALDGAKLIDDSAEWDDTLHAAAAEMRRLHAENATRAQQIAQDRADAGALIEWQVRGRHHYEWRRASEEIARAMYLVNPGHVRAVTVVEGAVPKSG